MYKADVSFMEEPLKYLCNWAFSLVKSALPDTIKETTKYDKFLAFSGGAISGFLMAQFGKSVVYPIVVEPFNVGLDDIVKTSLAVTVGSPAVAYGIAPKHAKQYLKDNPVYSAGVLGVMSGAVLRGVLELYS